MTDLIKTLVAEKFNLFNVDLDKAPINKKGKKMVKWQEKSYDELVAEHNYNSTMWELSLGEQSNGRYILSLDFDVYDKNTNSTCPNTEKLLNDYLSHCANKNGMYSSSTEGNMNVLVDYTENEPLKKYVREFGSAKFKKHGL